MSLKSRLVAKLDRPGLRFLLAALASLAISLRRAPCRVMWERGLWVHRFTDATLVDTRIRGFTPAYWRRRLEQVFLRHYRPHPGDVVVDLGAGTGTETVFLSRLVGDAGRVLAVEAHPRTYAALVAACRHNRLTNVTAVGAAIAEEGGTGALSDLPGHHSNFVRATGENLTGSGQTVVLTTLGELLDRYGVERVSLLKMNIEGSELPVLAHAGEVLSRVDNLVVSCHDFKAERTGDPFFRTREEVTRLLVAAGFEVRGSEQESPGWLRDTLYARRP